METRTRERRRRLLDLDEELGARLAPDRLEHARRELAAHVIDIAPGEWPAHWIDDDDDDDDDDDAAASGLIIVEGVMIGETRLHDAHTTELLGPGDLLRPWQADDDERLLASRVRWEALVPTRCAVLDPRLAAAAARYPEIGSVLLERAELRARRLAQIHAITQIKFVHRRLLALFWHLAARWGRVSADGVIVPLALSHRLLADLVGSRRPTVSTAIRQLNEEGELTRRADGTWLLQGEPALDDVPAEPVIRRQRVFMASVVADPDHELSPIVPVIAAHADGNAGQLADYRAAMERLRAISNLESERLATLSAQARELLAAQVALRERVSNR